MGNDMYFENEEQEAPKVIRRRKKQLYASIRERMEFYFSDANLQRDRFLSQLLKKDNEVDVEVFMKFNKILQLTNNIRDVVKALKKSTMLQLNESKTKIFRVTPIKEKLNPDACTIYVEQLSCDVDHDWLKDIFSKFGKVDYISIPKYKSSGKNKGFAFVEFETEEGAKKALKEFEKAGCCLTNHMNPEQLCSISTYEDDKMDIKNQYNQQMNVLDASNKGLVNNVGDSDVEKGKSKKRKNPEKLLSNGDNAGPKEKRRKESNSEENVSNDEGDKNISHEEPQEENKEKEGGEEVQGVKKKKNRKKKKSNRAKYVRDIQSFGLQILSKNDWKKLRNKYLNIQREKMKKLKQHLYKSQLNHSLRQQQIMEPQSTPRFEFKNGVVVKAVLDEPIDKANQISQLKCRAKSFPGVEYVDASPGNTEFYIRFNSPNAVEEIMQSKPWEKMTVLEGEEEQEYWEKMKRDRTEKFESKKKFSNKRGRNKLINKAEKLISKRIRLSVDD